MTTAVSMWFVPASLRGEAEVVRRMRTAIHYSWLVALVGAAFVGVHTATGAPGLTRWSTALGVVVGAVLPVLFRFGLSARGFASIAVLVFVAHQAVQIVVDGPSSWSVAWLVVPPLVGQTLGTPRIGLFGLALTLAVLFGYLGLYAVDAVPTPWGHRDGLLDTAVEVGGLIVCTHLLGFLATQEEQRAHQAMTAANAVLSREVDEHRKTQDRLGQAQAQVVRAARSAGMAEVATGVLHNLGNAMNAVTVSAQVLGDVVGRSELERRLERVRVLTAADADSPLGRYVAELARRCASEREAARKELGMLLAAVEHMGAVVAAHQVHARGRGVREEVEARDLVRLAVDLAAPSLSRHRARVALGPIPDLRVDTEPHEVVQILVNLIRNAAEAMDRTPGEREIRITVAVADGAVTVAVSDRGPGIPAGERGRVFQFGHTTKAGGHGFGLHTSAIAARRLGGHLALADAADGTGARFELALPLSDGHRSTAARVSRATSPACMS